ncbi:MAG: methylmalonyl-CoA mutase [Deltaproteobacteria bacterium]|nr:MAG: methylmalonyl-CoA mutase [Deltaproteobacteria bacterium]
MSVVSLQQAAPSEEWKPVNHLRFVTAASLFDGHDASINIMRRILQSQGVEVIHLGHDRSVAEVVDAAIEEDAHGIAVSSYQGGHVEYFTYMMEMLRERGCGGIKVFGGGGGTITDKEIELLESRGIEKIYSVEDGRRLGLVGMIRDMMMRADRDLLAEEDGIPEAAWEGSQPAIARGLTLLEMLNARSAEGDTSATTKLQQIRRQMQDKLAQKQVPVVGITGTGGAGKSSLTDELIRRLLEAFPDRNFGVLSVDPSRRRTGGALLGDRIRMNSVSSGCVFMRSVATRQAHASVSQATRDAISLMQTTGSELVILETAGIGQSGTEVVDLCDLPLYVMTPEFGAPSQLEKIDMLDYAEVVAINKSDKAGSEDALRYVRKQFQRNKGWFDKSVDDMPVFLCSASHFGDAGVDGLFAYLLKQVDQRTSRDWDPGEPPARAPKLNMLIPPNRVRYLSDIADTVRSYKAKGDEQAELLRKADGLFRSLEALGDSVPALAESYSDAALADDAAEPTLLVLRKRYNEILAQIDKQALENVRKYPSLRKSYTDKENVYEVRGREFRVQNYTESLSGNAIPKIALPQSKDWGEVSQWLWRENVPGEFPFTSGVFPYKRAGEDPARMFAGEGHPERTNKRFHYLSKGQPASRLSTAFDSVTLYGRDPGHRMDVYGKIGNSGVSVATLDDAKRLYSGFDLVSPKTSVSMTINGPAPMILAMFLNTAVDQQVEKRLKETGRWDEAQAKIKELAPDNPTYRADSLPEGHNGEGLGLLGVSGDQLLPPEEYREVRDATLQQVRGTVQADILKEDQAQNTCIFSTEFALKMMGDIQEYFVDHNVRNFYSVSISGYHIAEAGANPISQMAFTLANGFTFVEYYRSRGMDVDQFARNFSFFFSNGVDPEYAVIGRVARRIWSVAMRDLYGANERSQKLKYHIQTSGRSLHAQEITFNDIRTTLQALYALSDNCNSLHTNAFDEAITTPTEKSVRQALAIQLILTKEFGLLANENPLQGAYIIDELTEIVEEAILDEFERITSRGGVLGAMELMYQRSKIQEESLYYEHKKHSGDLPIVGVNTFLDPNAEDGVVEIELARSTEEEKTLQIDGCENFHARNKERSELALARLKKTAMEGGNLFAELMETVKSCSLGQITQALFEVGGQYRRNM